MKANSCLRAQWSTILSLYQFPKLANLQMASKDHLKLSTTYLQFKVLKKQLIKSVRVIMKAKLNWWKRKVPCSNRQIDRVMNRIRNTFKHRWELLIHKDILSQFNRRLVFKAKQQKNWSTRILMEGQ